MPKCERCGKEISSTEGRFCQDCFSKIINEKKGSDHPTRIPSRSSSGPGVRGSKDRKPFSSAAELLFLFAFTIGCILVISLFENVPVLFVLILCGIDFVLYVICMGINHAISRAAPNFHNRAVDVLEVISKALLITTFVGFPLILIITVIRLTYF